MARLDPSISKHINRIKDINTQTVIEHTLEVMSQAFAAGIASKQINAKYLLTPAAESDILDAIEYVKFEGHRLGLAIAALTEMVDSQWVRQEREGGAERGVGRRSEILPRLSTSLRDRIRNRQAKGTS